MAEIYTKRIPYFLDNVLNTPAGALPKGAQWVVAFDDLAGDIWPAIKKALTYEKKDWLINGAAEVVTSDAYQVTKGCVYCQAIDIPGESLVVNPEGNIMSNAFLRSYVGQGRNQFPVMRMTFLETNVSFADNFLRPWVIATGTFGLLARARGEEKNYRTNIYCYKLGAYSSDDETPTVLMKISFYDACCVSVSNEEYNYAPVTGQTIMREAQFVYNYYNIETDQGKIFQTTLNPSTQASTNKPQVTVNTDEFPNNFGRVTQSALNASVQKEGFGPNNFERITKQPTISTQRTKPTFSQVVAKTSEKQTPTPQSSFIKKQQQVSNSEAQRRDQIQNKIAEASRRPEEVAAESTPTKAQAVKATSNSFSAKAKSSLDGLKS